MEAPSQLKGLRGGVRGYAAQAILQIDADSAVVATKATMAKSAIAEKGHFWMETCYFNTIDLARSQSDQFWFDVPDGSSHNAPINRSVMTVERKWGVFLRPKMKNLGPFFPLSKFR